MTITIDFPPEMEKRLRQHAAATGKNVADIVLEVVEKTFQEEMTFDQVVEPIREGFEESGMTDEEMDALFEEAIKEVREERRKARS